MVPCLHAASSEEEWPGMSDMREVKTLAEYLPFAALTILTPRTGARPGAVSSVYEFYERDDMRAPVETLHFQSRPFHDGANGVTIETLLAVILDRLRHYQSGPLACEENWQVITKLEEALMWMRLRTDRRVQRGTYGEGQGET
jgi:hypothetical protein